METQSAATERITVDHLSNLIGELRMMARRLLDSESSRCSFTPTALAMTALRRAKLEEQSWHDVRWENRAHFFSALARTMRHALVDHARRRKARGRNCLVYVPPDDLLLRDPANEADQIPERLLLLEEALTQMEITHRRLAETVHQFYFLGHTIPEMARCNGLSEKTVDRDLKKARVLLRQMIKDGSSTRSA